MTLRGPTTRLPRSRNHPAPGTRVGLKPVDPE